MSEANHNANPRPSWLPARCTVLGADLVAGEVTLSVDGGFERCGIGGGRVVVLDEAAYLTLIKETAPAVPTPAEVEPVTPLETPPLDGVAGLVSINPFDAARAAVIARMEAATTPYAAVVPSPRDALGETLVAEFEEFIGLPTRASSAVEGDTRPGEASSMDLGSSPDDHGEGLPSSTQPRPDAVDQGGALEPQTAPVVRRLCTAGCGRPGKPSKNAMGAKNSMGLWCEEHRGLPREERNRIYYAAQDAKRLAAAEARKTAKGVGVSP